MIDEMMSVYSCSEEVLGEEEPFQPPLEEGEIFDPSYEEVAEDLAENIERGGLFGSSEGGEIELDESTLLHKARQLEEIQEASEEVVAAQNAYESARKAAMAKAHAEVDRG